MPEIAYFSTSAYGAVNGEKSSSRAGTSSRMAFYREACFHFSISSMAGSIPTLASPLFFAEQAFGDKRPASSSGLARPFRKAHAININFQTILREHGKLI